MKIMKQHVRVPIVHLADHGHTLSHVKTNLDMEFSPKDWNATEIYADCVPALHCNV